MISDLKAIFELIDSKSKRKVIFFGLCRVLTGIFDLIGVLLIGYILARLAADFSSNTEVLSIGSSALLNVLDNLTLINLSIVAAFTFILKSLTAMYFSYQTYLTLAQAEAKIAKNAFTLATNNMHWTIKNYSKSDLSYLYTYSSGAIIEIISGAIIVLAETFLLFLIISTFASVSIGLTLFILIYFLAIALTLNFFMGKKSGVFSDINARATISTNSAIFDSVQAYKEIKALKRESFFVNKFAKSKYESSLAGSMGAFLNGVPRFVIETALMLGALMLIALAFNANNLSESANSIGIFITGGLKITASILPLQASYLSYKTQQVRAKLLLDFILKINQQKQIGLIETNKPHSQRIVGPVGLNARDLCYSYEEEEVIKSLNLQIVPGQFVALIGPSGSGKSTLADLIIKILEPTGGSIEYVDSFRNTTSGDNFTFGYVAQKPGIVSGSIKQNIALGVEPEDVDQDSLIQAIKNSNLDELIWELAIGYDTDLGKQSDSLSGGQLQRIGLARALYGKPNLLILDEATSALDAESESSVTRSLEKLKGSCTIIVIAHRLSTVKNADKVFVLEKGKIIDSGNFSDLAKSNELVSRYIELSNLHTT